ncbi:M24 family metallopeptidase [soil metagenome]
MENSGNSRNNLIEAEEKAARLFSEIENRGLIAAGKSEKELNTEIFELAKELFGIDKYWHKRIVRSGKNTLFPYKENPPELILQKDDILFFDFGPVFEDWEADYGRTFVLGNNPLKHKLKNDIEIAWFEVRDWIFKQKDLTGEILYKFCIEVAKKYNWEFGGEIAGHLIGKFPHENIATEIFNNYIRPENKTNLFDPDENGNKKEWILEIHFVNREKEIGGFFEQLLR